MRTFGLNTGVGGNKKKASVLLGIVRFEYCPKNYESDIGEVRSVIHSKFGEVQKCGLRDVRCVVQMIQV